MRHPARPMTSLLRSLTLGAGLCLSLAAPAWALDVGGINVPDTVKVAGKDLKLNGAGMRTRFTFKVYVVGLYFTEKRNSVAEVLAAQGPRRIHLNIMRELASEEFGKIFMEAINKNVDKEEKSKLVAQFGQFGDIFEGVGILKKGDIVHVDWLPEKGMQFYVNSKPAGDIIPDILFYNAVTKIWLGNKPVQDDIKEALISGKPNA